MYPLAQAYLLEKVGHVITESPLLEAAANAESEDHAFKRSRRRKSGNATQMRRAKKKPTSSLRGIVARSLPEQGLSARAHRLQQQEQQTQKRGLAASQKGQLKIWTDAGGVPNRHVAQDQLPPIMPRIMIVDNRADDLDGWRDSLPNGVAKQCPRHASCNH